MLPKVESSCVEFHQEVSHLQGREFLLPHYLTRTQRVQERTLGVLESWVKGAAETQASVTVLYVSCSRSQETV